MAAGTEAAGTGASFVSFALLAVGLFLTGLAVIGVLMMLLRPRSSVLDMIVDDVDFDVDPVTGMGNERALARAMSRRRRDGNSPTAVISVEVDEWHGAPILDGSSDEQTESTDTASDWNAPSAGDIRAAFPAPRPASIDDVFEAIADAIARAIRPTDVAFRCDSARFAVLLPGATTVDAAPIAERVRREVIVAALRFDVLPVVSAGVASGPAHVVRAIAHTANDARASAQRRGGDHVEVA